MRFTFFHFLVLCLFVSCTRNQQGEDIAGNEDENTVYHIFYIDRSAKNIIWEQWDPELKNILQTSEIPLEINGVPEGGPQSDLLDSYVLQTSDDLSSLFLRTRVEPPFMGGMETDESLNVGSYLYQYKSGTGEFRELYKSPETAVINNFYYSDLAHSIFFEEIYPEYYVFKKLNLETSPAVETELMHSTNEILHISEDKSQEAIVALIQEEDQMRALIYTGEDTLYQQTSLPFPKRAAILPASAQDGNCFTLVFRKNKKYRYNALLTYCQALQINEFILPDEPQAVVKLNAQRWLTLGKESFFISNAKGRVIKRVCTPEPVFLASTVNEMFIRSGEKTYRYRLDTIIGDVLDPALHDRFFDLLNIKRGPAEIKKI